MNEQDKKQVEIWKRQLKTIKGELWDLIRVRVVGQRDREDIGDLLKNCLNRYNKILFKYEDIIESSRRK